MKETITRSLSGLLYVVLLITCLWFEQSITVLLFVFGLISMNEFLKLIQFKSKIPYFIFILIYGFIAYVKHFKVEHIAANEFIRIFIVLTIFVLLFLIRDLFSRKTIPLFSSKRYLLTTFYITSGFSFLFLIAHYFKIYNPNILLGSLILVWVNDTFAYLVGKNFGKQKLFEKISPKKTVEGFLGGLFFACIASFFIASCTNTLNSTYWLILSIIVSVTGTLGDLIESKFKRQAQVKDSGTIMPGHGGLLDRLDSIIFAAPFIYLFLRILHYVS
ncbi:MULTISPECIES: phosphatidate cytidylyltransferase [Algibacter]|jgi:phosphatidate cytidylyltransferase|uniref:Phosphatidate cytidylyltransferase n=1 Tax=Algibacter lectus TaxID=221126 RepID=A0A090VGG8_9FLAO|nr:phosphatidate cytidylyltransferase [Algibacter lectus]MDO7138409.1 phosphatidate cytidylyltransferase [Algibacter lectus]GAL63875.1 phosphatidate cytidylyltransferase [Algibacter lectus]GAL81446.1 phosphatidate cytidylyltransferase [Algibacter lectus]